MSPTYNIDDEREAAIVAWRLRCLEAAGLEPLDASALAVRRDIDRVDVENLLRAGASSAQVRGICL
jgi:cytochrome c-type biogenesis protein CcmH/NrfF